jgi:23S rRNA pseudouridine2605 synthase
MRTSVGYITGGPTLLSHTAKFGGGMGGQPRPQGRRGTQGAPGAGGGNNVGRGQGRPQRRGGEANGNVMPQAGKPSGNRRPRGRNGNHNH